MKSLYFMRHGPAVQKSSMLYEEKDRPLTEDGIKRIVKETKGFSRVEGSFDLILYSPLKRSAQTAALVAAGLGCEKKLEACNELAPKTSFNMLMAAIEKHKNKSKILLVGHEPDLAMAISLLLGAENPGILLKKGAICRIDIETLPSGNTVQLAWLMQPRALRLLGGK